MWAFIQMRASYSCFLSLKKCLDSLALQDFEKILVFIFQQIYNNYLELFPLIVTSKFTSVKCSLSLWKHTRKNYAKNIDCLLKKHDVLEITQFICFSKVLLWFSRDGIQSSEIGRHWGIALWVEIYWLRKILSDQCARNPLWRHSKGR